MTDSQYTIEDLQIREVVEDPNNFIAEGSLDIRGDSVVMVYGRYRGLVHSDDGDILCTTSRDGGTTWDATPSVVMAHYPRWGFTSPSVKILRDGKVIDGTWRADDVNQPPLFFDAGGAPIPLHPGRTWFQIVEPHYSVTVG